MCDRCQRFGVKCDGFPPPQRLNDKTHDIYAKAPRHIRPLVRNPPVFIFEDDRERRYFQAFIGKSTYDSNGSTHIKPWQKTIMHACQDEIGLRLAASAIGALSAAQIWSQDRLALSKNRPDEHYQYAFTRYDKALKIMKEAKNTRTALLASLLIFYFENLTGSFNTALRQAKIGLKLLHEVLTQNAKPATSEKVPSSTLPDRLDDSYPKLLAKAPQLLPTPTDLGHDLIEIFLHIEIQTMAFNGLLSVSNIAHKVNPFSTKFVDLKEARLALVHIFVRVVRFIPFKPEFTPSCPYYTAKDHANGKSPLDPWQDGMESRSIEYAACTAQLRTWFQAFAHLKQSCNSSSQVNCLVSIAPLEINATALKILLESAESTNESCFDIFIDDFKTILSLSKTIVQQQTADDPFVGYGASLPLFLTAKHCRDGTIRREAIALLRRAKGREAGWDSDLLGCVATHLMTIEEEGMVDGIIAEEARVRLVGLNLDYPKRTGTIRIMYGAKEGEEARSREVEMKW